MGVNYQPHLFGWISAINSILTESMITFIHVEIVMKVHNYNVQSIHGISRRPVSKYHGIKALTLQTFLHKIKSRIMWLYKQVVLLTVYQLWPCNNKTGPLFFTNAKALLLSSTNFSKLSWIPHQTTKQSTPPLLLSWILEQNPPKKNGGKKTPPGKNGEKTGTSTNSPPLSTNIKCSQMHLLCKKTDEFAASQRWCFRISCFKLPWMSRRQKWHQSLHLLK